MSTSTGQSGQAAHPERSRGVGRDDRHSEIPQPEGRARDAEGDQQPGREQPPTRGEDYEDAERNQRDHDRVDRQPILIRHDRPDRSLSLNGTTTPIMVSTAAPTRSAGTRMPRGAAGSTDVGLRQRQPDAGHDEEHGARYDSGESDSDSPPWLRCRIRDSERQAQQAEVLDRACDAEADQEPCAQLARPGTERERERCQRSEDEGHRGEPREEAGVLDTVCAELQVEPGATARRPRGSGRRSRAGRPPRSERTAAPRSTRSVVAAVAARR